MHIKNLIQKLFFSKSSGSIPGEKSTTQFSLPPFNFEDATGKLRYRMTNDLLVKLLLERNEKVLKALISALLHIPVESITDIQILNPFFLGQSVDAKNTALDIHLIINNNQSLDLEIQVVKEDFWQNRSILYLCRQYDRLKIGEDYTKLIPAIHIGILDFDLFPGEEPEFFSTYKLLNIKNHKLYSDKLQVNVLNLNQIDYATDEDKVSGIHYWAKLFKATTWEDLKMLAIQDPIFKDASETIHDITNEDSLRAYLLSREIYALDVLTRENRDKRRVEEMKKLSEDMRKLSAEKNKISAEIDKISAEIDKISAEKDKISAEKDKISAEKDKISAEKDKISAEKDRLSSEFENLSSENARLRALLLENGLAIN